MQVPIQMQVLYNTYSYSTKLISVISVRPSSTLRMMFSRPGHPFWRLLLNSIRGQQRRGDVIGSVHMMGVLHSVWDLFNNGSLAHSSIVPLPSAAAAAATPPVPPYNQAEPQPLAVGVYAGHVFNPVSYMARRVSPCRDFNNMNDTQLQECISFHRRNRETHVLQVHTQSWGWGMKAVNRT